MGSIQDELGDGVVFTLKLLDKGEKKNREYVLRARNVAEAEKWFEKLNAIKDDANSSTIKEEEEDEEQHEDMDIKLIATPYLSCSGGGEESSDRQKDAKEDKSSACACCVIQ